MASKRREWTSENLQAALKAVRSDNLSLRRAEATFGVPKSTLAFYLSGKAEVGAKPGPFSILTAAEEAKLVEYIVHMSEIGYRRIKENVLDIVKSIIGCPNPFCRWKTWQEMVEAFQAVPPIRKAQPLKISQSYMLHTR